MPNNASAERVSQTKFAIYPIANRYPALACSKGRKVTVSEWPAGGGMGACIESADWASSPIGPVAEWPAALRAAVRLILPAKAQIVMFVGPEFVSIYNAAYAPTIGDKHPRALGRPAKENWSELWDDLEPLLQQVYRTGETVSATDRRFYIERFGYPEDVYFDISYSPILDDDGKILGVLCIVSETTKRVEAQEALRASEERLRAVFSQAAGGIAQTDGEGRLVFVNRKFCEIAGYDESEILGMRIEEIIHPDDRSQSAHLFRKLVEKGAAFEVEQRYIRKDASQVWVSSSVSPIRSSKGQVRQAAALVLDITERKRAEENVRRLAAIILSSHDAILSTDLDMRIASWNWGAERLYGYKADEVMGQQVTVLVPQDRPGEEAGILERIRRGERVEPHETKRCHKDGRLIDVMLTVSPVRDEHGRIVGASKIAHDISARKEAERLQRILMGELKHRVKNVIATVQAIARQTLGADDGMRPAQETFEARLQSFARAHDLLTRESWDGADIGEVIKETLSPYSRASFDIDGPSLRLSPRVVVAFSLALHELATNAAKYGALSSPAGRVTIGWTVDLKNDSRLELRWKEQGGPPVTSPTRRGFGSRLIEGVLAAELQGTVNVLYEPAGLLCEVSAPMHTAW